MFLWCHASLNYDGIEFPVRGKGFTKIEKMNNIYINVFCYENKLTFPIYVSDQKPEKSMGLQFVIDENKSHSVYIKDFNTFMFHKTKNKNKSIFQYFSKSCLQCFSCKKVLTNHKEVCLNINSAQSVRLEKVTIESKNYFKQIPVLFKIYVDFECNLMSSESDEGSYSKNIKITFFVVLLTNLFVFVMNLLSHQLFLEVKTQLINLKQFLKSLNTIKK